MNRSSLPVLALAVTLGLAGSANAQQNDTNVLAASAGDASSSADIDAPRRSGTAGSLGILALIGVGALACAIAVTTRRRIRGERI